MVSFRHGRSNLNADADTDTDSDAYLIISQAKYCSTKPSGRASFKPTVLDHSERVSHSTRDSARLPPFQSVTLTPLEKGSGRIGRMEAESQVLNTMRCLDVTADQQPLVITVSSKQELINLLRFGVAVGAPKQGLTTSPRLLQYLLTACSGVMSMRCWRSCKIFHGSP